MRRQHGYDKLTRVIVATDKAPKAFTCFFHSLLLLNRLAVLAGHVLYLQGRLDVLHLLCASFAVVHWNWKAWTDDGDFFQCPQVAGFEITAEVTDRVVSIARPDSVAKDNFLQGGAVRCEQ